MSDERVMIDLDEHRREPAEPSSNTHDRLAGRPKTVLRLIAAAVVGLVLGGVAVNELRDSREQRERSSSVVLVAVPVAVVNGWPLDTGFVQINGQLELINAGSAPITVGAARAQQPGIILIDIGQSRLLSPGGTGRIDVKLEIECATAFKGDELQMQFSIKTDDKEIRVASYPVSLIGSAWHYLAMSLCEASA